MNGTATPPFSITIIVLVTLLAIFAASWAMFWGLVRRWTWDREWVALSDWARDAGFHIRRHPGTDPLPAPLDSIRMHHPSPSVILSDARGTLMRVETAAPPPPAATVTGGIQPASADAKARWNLALRHLESPWPPTGLRPTGRATSLVDLFPLSSFPLLGAGERFTIFGTDSSAAAALSASSARALLPPDVGLLLHGNQLVLDFSGRPFDSIEFERMLVIADQIVSHLPPGAA